MKDRWKIKHCPMCGSPDGNLNPNPSRYKRSNTVTLCPPCEEEIRNKGFSSFKEYLLSTLTNEVAWGALYKAATDHRLARSKGI